MTMKSSTETIILAMRLLATDIESDDGVANAAIAEAAQRMAEQHAALRKIAAIKPAGAAPKLREAIRIARDALQESARCAE